MLIFSQSSNDSPQVLREIERGVNKRIPILVFRIEETPLSKAMEYFLSVPHWFDALTAPIETHLQPLTQAISQLLGAPSTATDQPKAIEVSATPEPSPSLPPTLDLPSEPTFLFTDIEGSTKLWEQYRDSMQLALATHDQVIRQAVQQNNGRVFKTIGDAFCAVFAKATEALAAAQQAQDGLQELTVADQPLKVRMALHTGTAERRNEDFFGPTLNRVARLLAVGHGRQILLSQATRNLLPESEPILDLGMHRLKDLQQPEHVWQASISPHPPLRSLSLYENNLPQQVTSFVGREKERAEIKLQLSNVRLLTLVGSGGTGKTRLSLQVAAEVLDQFPDGIWLVELAPLTDPSHIGQALAEALSVREVPGEAITKTLLAVLKEKQTLLILDNGEHLLEAIARLVDSILRSCPKVKVMVSSREALGIAGETPYRVPSLTVPQQNKTYTPEGLADFESVKLFVERAVAAKQDFQITHSNVHTCAKVCHQLDGIPLAIELAAARIRSMPIENLAARLEDRFKILTGGSRTALPRQQTLRALIDWSYDLLEENQKALLTRISVFAGGCTLEAAENVCQGDLVEDWEVLDLLTALHDKSLLVYEERDGSARYRLLEMVRQYAREKLTERGETEATAEKHRDCFLELAQQAEPKLIGAEQALWFERLEEEYENLRVALEWSLREADPAGGLQLCGVLHRFWVTRGYLAEGRSWCVRALEQDERRAFPTERAKVLNGVGILAKAQGDNATAQNYQEESLALYRELGDKRGISSTLNSLGNVAWTLGSYESAKTYHEESLALYHELGDKAGISTTLNSLGNVAWAQGDYESARGYYEQSRVIVRELGDKRGISRTLNSLGNVAWAQGDYESARGYYEQSLMLFREIGDKSGMAYALNSVGGVAWAQNDPAAARGHFEESLGIFREIGDKRGISIALNNLGSVVTGQGDDDAARIYYEQSLALFQEIGDKSGIAGCLKVFADLAFRGNKPEQAVALWAAAETLREEIGVPIPADQKEQYELNTAAATEALGNEAFQKAWEQGQALSLEEAVALSLNR